MTKVRERLQLAARHAGVGDSQSEIATDLGLKRQTVNHWFNKGAPEAENLALIEKRWGISGEWLRSGEGSMLPQPSTDGLTEEERNLVKDYRRAPADRRPMILSIVRAAKKAVVTIAAAIPPLLASPNHTDAAILHKQNCVPEGTVIHIACHWIISWLRSLRFVQVAAFA